MSQTHPRGSFHVLVWWGAGGQTKATNAPYTVAWDLNSVTFFLDQQTASKMWYELPIPSPTITDDMQPFTVKLTNQANGEVMADAVMVSFGTSQMTDPRLNRSRITIDMSGNEVSASGCGNTNHVWAVRGMSSGYTSNCVI